MQPLENQAHPTTCPDDSTCKKPAKSLINQLLQLEKTLKYSVSKIVTLQNWDKTLEMVNT